MKRSAISLERTPFGFVTIRSLERRLFFVKRTMEWFHHHGVDVKEVEKHLHILDPIVPCLKEGEGIGTSLAREGHRRRMKEVWELLSRFSGMVVHQKGLLQVAFEMVEDVEKFDDDTLQVASRVKEIDEEANREDLANEADDETEACSRYVSLFWGELEDMFPPIQCSLGQLKQGSMDTRIYKESFGILTYTIWRFEQEEMKAEAEVMEARLIEAKGRLRALLDRLDGFLAGLIRPWKDRQQLLEDLVSFDRANYHVVRTLVVEEKSPRDFASTSIEYPANYKRRAVSAQRDFPTGCGRANTSVKASVVEEKEEDPTEEEEDPSEDETFGRADD